MARSVMAESNDLDRLDHARTERTFWRIFEQVIAADGFDFYIFLWRRRDGTLCHRTNLPDDYYADAESDPFLRYCCNTMGVTLAGADFQMRRAVLTRKENAFVERAAGAGWRSGIAIPVQVRRHPEFGGFNLGSRMPGATFETAVSPQVDKLRALCLFAHWMLDQRGWIEGMSGRRLPASSALTTRQRQIAGLLCTGMDRNAVSDRLGISVQTVATHQKGIYRRLGVRSQRQLMQTMHDSSDAISHFD